MGEPLFGQTDYLMIVHLTCLICVTISHSSFLDTIFKWKKHPIQSAPITKPITQANANFYFDSSSQDPGSNCPLANPCNSFNDVSFTGSDKLYVIGDIMLNRSLDFNGLITSYTPSTQPSSATIYVGGSGNFYITKTTNITHLTFAIFENPSNPVFQISTSESIQFSNVAVVMVDDYDNPSPVQNDVSEHLVVRTQSAGLTSFDTFKIQGFSTSMSLIFISGGTTTFDGCEFYDIKSTNDDAHPIDISDATSVVNIKNSFFDSLNGKKTGAAAHIVGKEITLANTSATNCILTESESKGGAFYFETPNLTLSKTLTFRGNEADYGKDIYQEATSPGKIDPEVLDPQNDPGNSIAGGSDNGTLLKPYSGSTVYFSDFGFSSDCGSATFPCSNLNVTGSEFTTKAVIYCIVDEITCQRQINLTPVTGITSATVQSLTIATTPSTVAFKDSTLSGAAAFTSTCSVTFNTITFDAIGTAKIVEVAQDGITVTFKTCAFTGEGEEISGPIVDGTHTLSIDAMSVAPITLKTPFIEVTSTSTIKSIWAADIEVKQTTLIKQSAQLTLESSSFHGITSTGAKGSVLNAEATSTTIRNTSFTSCKPTGTITYGGAVFTTNTLTLSNVSFSENEATFGRSIFIGGDQVKNLNSSHVSYESDLHHAIQFNSQIPTSDNLDSYKAIQDSFTNPTLATPPRTTLYFAEMGQDFNDCGTTNYPCRSLSFRAKGITSGSKPQSWYILDASTLFYDWVCSVSLSISTPAESSPSMSQLTFESKYNTKPCLKVSGNLTLNELSIFVLATPGNNLFEVTGTLRITQCTIDNDDSTRITLFEATDCVVKDLTLASLELSNVFKSGNVDADNINAIDLSITEPFFTVRDPQTSSITLSLKNSEFHSVGTENEVLFGGLVKSVTIDKVLFDSCLPSTAHHLMNFKVTTKDSLNFKNMTLTNNLQDNWEKGCIFIEVAGNFNSFGELNLYGLNNNKNAKSGSVGRDLFIVTDDGQLQALVDNYEASFESFLQDGFDALGSSWGQNGSLTPVDLFSLLKSRKDLLEVYVDDSGFDFSLCGSSAVPCKTFSETHKLIRSGGAIYVLTSLVITENPSGEDKKESYTLSVEGIPSIVTLDLGANSFEIGGTVLMSNLWFEAKTTGTSVFDLNGSGSLEMQNCILSQIDSHSPQVMFTLAQNSKLLVFGSTIDFNCHVLQGTLKNNTVTISDCDITLSGTQTPSIFEDVISENSTITLYSLDVHSDSQITIESKASSQNYPHLHWICFFDVKNIPLINYKLESDITEHLDLIRLDPEYMTDTYINANFTYCNEIPSVTYVPSNSLGTLAKTINVITDDPELLNTINIDTSLNLSSTIELNRYHLATTRTTKWTFNVNKGQLKTIRTLKLSKVDFKISSTQDIPVVSSRKYGEVIIEAASLTGGTASVSLIQATEGLVTLNDVTIGNVALTSTTSPFLDLTNLEDLSITELVATNITVQAPFCKAESSHIIIVSSTFSKITTTRNLTGTVLSLASSGTSPDSEFEIIPTPEQVSGIMLDRVQVSECRASGSTHSIITVTLDSDAQLFLVDSDLRNNDQAAPSTTPKALTLYDHSMQHPSYYFIHTQFSKYPASEAHTFIRIFTAAEPWEGSFYFSYQNLNKIGVVFQHDGTESYIDFKEYTNNNIYTRTYNRAGNLFSVDNPFCGTENLPCDTIDYAVGRLSGSGKTITLLDKGRFAQTQTINQVKITSPFKDGDQQFYRAEVPSSIQLTCTNTVFDHVEFHGDFTGMADPSFILQTNTTIQSCKISKWSNPAPIFRLSSGSLTVDDLVSVSNNPSEPISIRGTIFTVTSTTASTINIKSVTMTNIETFNSPLLLFANVSNYTIVLDQITCENVTSESAVSGGIVFYQLRGAVTSLLVNNSYFKQCKIAKTPKESSRGGVFFINDTDGRNKLSFENMDVPSKGFDGNSAGLGNDMYIIGSNFNTSLKPQQFDYGLNTSDDTALYGHDKINTISHDLMIYFFYRNEIIHVRYSPEPLSQPELCGASTNPCTSIEQGSEHLTGSNRIIKLIDNNDSPPSSTIEKSYTLNGYCLHAGDSRLVEVSGSLTPCLFSTSNSGFTGFTFTSTGTLYFCKHTYGSLTIDDCQFFSAPDSVIACLQSTVNSTLIITDSVFDTGATIKWHLNNNHNVKIHQGTKFNTDNINSEAYSALTLNVATGTDSSKFYINASYSTPPPTDFINEGRRVMIMSDNLTSFVSINQFDVDLGSASLQRSYFGQTTKGEDTHNLEKYFRPQYEKCYVSSSGDDNVRCGTFGKPCKTYYTGFFHTAVQGTLYLQDNQFSYETAHLYCSYTPFLQSKGGLTVQSSEPTLRNTIQLKHQHVFEASTDIAKFTMLDFVVSGIDTPSLLFQSSSPLTFSHCTFVGKNPVLCSFAKITTQALTLESVTIHDFDCSASSTHFISTSGSFTFTNLAVSKMTLAKSFIYGTSSNGTTTLNGCEFDQITSNEDSAVLSTLDGRYSTSISNSIFTKVKGYERGGTIRTQFGNSRSFNLTSCTFSDGEIITPVTPSSKAYGGYIYLHSSDVNCKNFTYTNVDFMDHKNYVETPTGFIQSGENITETPDSGVLGVYLFLNMRNVSDSCRSSYYNFHYEWPFKQANTLIAGQVDGSVSVLTNITYLLLFNFEGRDNSYVNNPGSYDKNCGTMNAPCITINHAIATLTLLKDSQTQRKGTVILMQETFVQPEPICVGPSFCHLVGKPTTLTFTKLTLSSTTNNVASFTNARFICFSGSITIEKIDINTEGQNAVFLYQVTPTDNIRDTQTNGFGFIESKISSSGSGLTFLSRQSTWLLHNASFQSLSLSSLGAKFTEYLSSIKASSSTLKPKNLELSQITDATTYLATTFSGFDAITLNGLDFTDKQCTTTEQPLVSVTASNGTVIISNCIFKNWAGSVSRAKAVLITLNEAGSAANVTGCTFEEETMKDALALSISVKSRSTVAVGSAFKTTDVAEKPFAVIELSESSKESNASFAHSTFTNCKSEIKVQYEEDGITFDWDDDRGDDDVFLTTA
ncbi:hypothetical protein BLNAU_12711 [Blattamonas nauphoetae]|uniref:Uncharacterized protein n=1 Tax=Blattamonas nauphoetae TaxID=2049346 RepID=A0ABQ9XNX6_9EUKA|nr:hypothetical protein BLNAU_12711 [Blattamonas nauphoetae]